MTPLVYANEIVFCFTMSAYLLAAFLGVVCFAMSVYYKLKPQYVLPEIIVSAASVLLFCYLSDAVQIRRFGANLSDFSGSPCFMPLWSVILIAAGLLALVAFLLVLVVKKRLSSLTAMSVKESVEALPVGLCFYDETGRILLLNEQVANDCKELTGTPLYDGNVFWSSVSEEKVADGITVSQNEGSLIVERADGRVTLCKRIVHDMGGKRVYELCGTDISREFALKKEIEQKNENLRKMNSRLRKYGEIVAEVTREKEVLGARIKVHGNLGSLILRTKKALAQGEFDRALLISEWNDILSLIFAPDDEQDKFAEADKTAASVGVRIFYDGKRPKKGTQAEKIFAGAVFECVTNTARHADGTELYVKMTESDAEYAVTLTNNGRHPEQDIKEGGGLSSLRTMAENADGQMTVESVPKFSLTITVPKEKQENER